MNICRVPSSALFSRLAPALVCLAVAVGLLYYGQMVLKPLALAGLLALLLTSPCRFFERQGFPRGYAAMIVLLFALVFFILVFYFIFNAILSFRNDLPLIKQNIDASLLQLEAMLSRWLRVPATRMHTIMQNSQANLLPKTSYLVNRALTLGSVVLFAGIMLLIMTFLMLLYRGLIVAFFRQLFAEEHSGVITGLFERIHYVVRNYITGLLIEMVIVATAFFLVLFLLGIQYALLLAVISAIIKILPYVGITIACLLTALISLTTNTPATVLWAVVSMLIIHMIDGNILNPVIIGSKIRINALAAIVAVITMAAIWGLAGTFMALPLLAILKVVFEEIPPLRPFALLMGDTPPPAPHRGVLHWPIVKQIRHRRPK
ncbi:AI-2E family transporter [Flaviaesturariibacter flavus]|uniref:AI-2E family transporter n=1 Tax=Flaviaesturariibacter flavus TaxID=2502780 RepID=A0A4R1BF80_9BACT|nr:AI-2E family transporter [Flaviaesturariibacter flavus]TCJ15835.1 AI-2E family transporter [Flaviaesturariibacter flavus]